MIFTARVFTSDFFRLEMSNLSAQATYKTRKDMLLPDSSRAFGCPQRYIQGPGEFRHVFEYGSEYGKRFLFLIDEGIYDMVLGMLAAIENKADCSYETVSFSGESCMEAVAELSALVATYHCDVLVGVGGGKVLDTAKLVADEVDMPRIIAPTSAASDAPAADWAAIYTPEGVHIGGRRTRRSTELVLVDSEVIAKAPARLFSAGIGDALATWFEAVACDRSSSPNCVTRGYRRTRAAMAVSKECFDILMQDGVAALRAVKAKTVTEAVENVIEANTLLSGMGFINGGLAAGHGIHSGLSEVPGGETSMHGEKVAFALLAQLVIENAPFSKIFEIMEFLHKVDLPVTIEQLGIECTPENLELIAEHTVERNPLIHHEPVAVSRELVKNAIIVANAYGHDYLDSLNK